MRLKRTIADSKFSQRTCSAASFMTHFSSSHVLRPGALPTAKRTGATSHGLSVSLESSNAHRFVLLIPVRCQHCCHWRTPTSQPPHKVVLPSGCRGPLALRDPPEGGLLPTDPEAGSSGRSERAFQLRHRLNTHWYATDKKSAAIMPYPHRLLLHQQAEVDEDMA